jgi:ribosomal protein S21
VEERGDAMQVEQEPGESFEAMLRRFGRTIIKSGILGEAKRKRHYLSKGEARRAKAKASARKKRRRAAREAQRAAGRPPPRKAPPRRP